MVNCAAPGCGRHSRKFKSEDVKGWHSVPTAMENSQLRTQWLTAMKREPPYPLDKNFYLCGLHFSDDCFHRDIKHEMMGGKKTFKLIDTAVPDNFYFSKDNKRRVSSHERADKQIKKETRK